VTLGVSEGEGRVGSAERVGEALVSGLRRPQERQLASPTSGGLGMMRAVAFAPADGLKHRAAWKVLDAAQAGFSSQLVIVPFFTEHRIRSQPAVHDLAVVNFLPPLCIDAADRRWIVDALNEGTGATENVGGALWDLGKSLANVAILARGGRERARRPLRGPRGPWS
jgi:acetylornithine/succinyldiaminopimelate/putrescine aminotransferase